MRSKDVRNTDIHRMARMRVGVPVLLVAMFLTLLALSGCGSSPQQVAGTSPGPRATSTINIAIPGDTTTLDPDGTELIVWAIIRNQVFDALFNMDPKTLQMQSRLAQSWNWDDPKTLDVKLRQGVKFHDGQPLTADDVKFSILRYKDPTTGSPFRGRMAAVDTIDVVSPLELKIHLSTPNAGLVGALGQVYMVQKDTPKENFKTHANGTGPYKLVDWQQGNFIKLVPNADYWAGKPPADNLVFKVMSQTETQVSSVQAGNVDMLLDVDLTQVPRLQKSSDINITLPPAGDSMWVAYLNARRPAMKDERVRQALAYALDRATFVRDFAQGLARVTNSPHPVNSPFYDKSTEGQYPYDLKKAAQLLADAGYPGGKGLNLTFLVPANYPDFQNGTEMWQAALAQLGVHVTVNRLELAAWFTTVATKFDFDVAFELKQDGASDPAVLYATTGSFAPGPTNRNGLFENTYPELTSLLAQGQSTLDTAQRVQIYNQINQFWNQHLIQYTIAAKPNAYALRKNVSGFDAHPSIRYLDLSHLQKQ